MDLGRLLDDLNDDSEFEEIPVDLETFMGPGYLEQTGVTLSYYQKELIEHLTHIYKYETMVSLYGEAEAQKRNKYDVREVIAMWGKGSGKDFCSEIACCYLVYKLMCLKDPSRYLGRPPGDSLDIINVAINSEQARNVFFKGFSRMITNSPWFAGRHHPKQRVIEFEKNITVYSGHSEAEAFEGYNTIMVILDEIAGFEHHPAGADGEDKGSAAKAIYDMYSDSLTSRFPDRGKLALLSFPRRKGDFITSRYEKAVVDAVHHPREHTFVFNENIPEDTPGNSFTIQWSEDEVLSYFAPGVWASRRPSWEVNPTKDIEMYKTKFYEDVNVALGKFAAEPQESIGGFFGSHDDIDNFSNYANGLDPENVFYSWFKPIEDKDYFIHVDLARKHDRCVVAMSHVSGWQRGGFQGGEDGLSPVVSVDLIRYWTPDRSTQVNFVEVRDFIMDLIRAGFPVKRVTFDQWQSEEMIAYFNQVGVRAEVLSVGLQHYMDLKIILAEQRGRAPHNEILRRELKELFITKNGKNVDHPRTTHGSKDIADAVCGSVFSAANLTPRDNFGEIQVYSRDDIKKTIDESDGLQFGAPRRQRSDMPKDLADYMTLI